MFDIFAGMDVTDPAQEVLEFIVNSVMAFFSGLRINGYTMEVKFSI